MKTLRYFDGQILINILVGMGRLIQKISRRMQVVVMKALKILRIVYVQYHVYNTRSKCM